MNFLQRIKEGASKVSEKAQNSVEVGKLNSRITEIESEMEIEFLKMGKLFYEGCRAKDLSGAEGQMLELAKACTKHQDKIDGLRARIAELKNERLCRCGHVVALDANFCPKCGSKLEPSSTVKPSAALDDEEDGESEAAGATAQGRSNAYEAYKEYRELFADAKEDEFLPPFDPYEGPSDEEQAMNDSKPEAAAVLEETDEDPFFRLRGQEDNPLGSRERRTKFSYAEIDESEELPLPLSRPEGMDGEETERDRRLAADLERERERQLELDRRIRDWQAGAPEESEAEAEGPRETVSCQICRMDLPKGSMWCPRCGSEQI